MKTKKQTWEDRFDEEIYITFGTDDFENTESVKWFIQTELDQAKKEERERIVKEIKELDVADSTEVGGRGKAIWMIDDLLARLEK